MHRKHHIYIFIAIIIKIINLVAIKAIDKSSNIGSIQNENIQLYNIVNGDDVTYIEFCENVYKIGNYAVKVGHSFDYTFRMPGIAFVYIPLRYFFSQNSTLNIIVILQVIFSAVSMYLMALLAKEIFKNIKLFYIVFIAASLDFCMPFYNQLLITESFAISALITSIYFFNKSFQDNNFSKTYLFASGLFMSWCIFLRPFMLIFYIVLCLLVFAESKHYPFYNRIKLIFIFTLSFLILDGFWTYRNYKISHKFIPLQTSNSWTAGTSESYKQSLNFIKDFGFHWEPWVRNSESGWLFSEGSISNRNNIFTKRTFNGDLNIDSLIIARRDMKLSMNKSITENERYNADQNALRLFNKFSYELKKNRPLDYYFLNRIRILKSFYVEQFYYPIFKLKFPLNAIILVFNLFIDNFIRIIGWIGLIYLMWYQGLSLKKKLLIISVPLYITLFFPIYLQIDESRFLALAYPFLIISSSLLLSKLITYRKQSGYLIVFLTLLIPLLLSLYSVGIKLYHGY